jgi:carbamate kinase
MTRLRDPRLLVIALGAKSLRSPGASSSPCVWMRMLERSLPPLVDVVAAGFRLVLTSGAGPRGEGPRPEQGRRAAPPLPTLDVDRAETQGATGYAIQQVLGNLCRGRNVEASIAVVGTRVRIDPADPALRRPTRPVGPSYGVAQARRLERERGWAFARTSGRRRRRIVPSPQPRGVLEADAIRRLADAGVVVIAAAGGGVPVVETALGHQGVEAVLQHDATAAVLATAIGADRLVFLTGVERAEVGHRTARAIGIEHLSVADARALLSTGEFPPGSMGAKIEAAIAFVEAGGGEAIIASLPGVRAALDGRGGTRVVP